MAELNTQTWEGARRAGSPLGPLARAQYAALARMRLSLLLNGLRTSEGALEQGSRWAGVAAYGAMGFGIGVGAGWAAYVLIAHGSWQVLPVEFWFVCVLWQTVAVALAAFQEQYDVAGLLRFPVNFGSYFVLSVVTSLLDASTLLGVLGSVGILIGATLARPGLWGWSATAVAAFVVFNLLLTRAVVAWMERWLAQRRTREIAGGLLLAAVVCLQLLNPALMPVTHLGLNSTERMPVDGPMLHLTPWVQGMGTVQAWLPPGLEARALEQAGTRHANRAAQTLGMLGFYVLLAGGLLAVRLRADYRGENLAEAVPAGDYLQAKRTRHWEGEGIAGVVWAKELRILSRSMPNLYVLLTPLAMVFPIASLLKLANGLNGYALPLCVAYALLGFAQLMYNSIGGDGPGAQILLLSPTPLAKVFSAKNALLAALYVTVASLAAVLTICPLGVPPAAICGATAAWVVFSLGMNLAAGNAISARLPYRMNHGRLMRQSGSHANGLVSMAVQSMDALVGVGVMIFSYALGRQWLAVPILLVLAAGAWLAWWMELRRIETTVRGRGEYLLERLARID